MTHKRATTPTAPNATQQSRKGNGRRRFGALEVVGNSEALENPDQLVAISRRVIRNNDLSEYTQYRHFPISPMEPS